MEKLTDKKERVYSLLENRMVKYRDLIDIPVEDNKEHFVILSDPRIRSGYHINFPEIMIPFKNILPVREGVALRLTDAQNRLSLYNPQLHLRITYGYRDLAIQKARYEEMKAKIAANGTFDKEIDLEEEVHRFIAVPEVAGHPTGGAVDVIIEDEKGAELNFGSPIYDFSTKDCYYGNPYINNISKRNRKILRTCMMDAGFAPFDGEYWHFSFGDREWAFYYKQPKAIYSQKGLSEVKII